MAATKFGATLETVWADYRRCATRSRSLKTILDRTRLVALILVTASAVFGLLSAQLPDPYNPVRIFAFLSAVAAAIGAYITAQALSLGLEREWVLSRSIAEALKSEAYRYLARAQPYDSADPVENDEVLGQKAADYRDRITLGAFLDLTEAAQREGLPADWLTMAQYLEARVRDQINFYRRNAAKHTKKASRLTTTTIVLGGLAAVLGAAHGVNEHLSFLAAWIAVVTSVSGAVTTYLFANRLRALAQSYETTSVRLDRLVASWHRVRDQDKAAKAGEFVNRFEDVMLVENKQWVAEFDKPSEGGAEPAQPGKAGPAAAAPPAAPTPATPAPVPAPGESPGAGEDKRN